MTKTVTLTMPRLGHDGSPNPRSDGRRVVEVELRCQLSEAEILAAVEQAHEERAATVQDGSPEALEVWRYVPGTREIRDSAMKRRVVAIDDIPFDQSTGNAEFRAMWTDLQWQAIEHAVDRLDVVQEGGDAR